MTQTILVVDDEPDFVEMLTWVLNKEGYVVESASGGLEGLNKAKIVLPDLIVLDLMLPELDGRAVCEILRQLPSTAAIPVLMLTGCATEACKAIALEAGVDEYVTKPFSPKMLVSKIRTTLDRNRREPELQALDDALW
jgi:DNA-binding response OmpR family regulator